MTRSAPARKLALPEVTTTLCTAASLSAKSISASRASISPAEKTFIVRSGMSIFATSTPSASSSLRIRSSSMHAVAIASRGSGEFLEVGLAPLVERLHAFFRFVALVVVLDRLDAEEADAADVLRVGVERALGDRQRRRAQLVDLLAPLLDLGVELVVRHDLVD